MTKIQPFKFLPIYGLKAVLVFISILLTVGCVQTTEKSAQNPIIWADVPDPSVIRVEDTYYMSSTTMHFNPGVPIMKSDDLVNWRIVNYAYDILGKNDTLLLENKENAYGEGSWASSLRHHNGVFYVATFSYTTQKTYIFRTEDIESGSWETFTIDGIYHDPSLIFDDSRAFLVYGIDDIQIIELTADATALKENGVKKALIPNSKRIAGDGFNVPAEGAHIQKINGAYYVSLISWPSGGMRTQLIYRSDSLLGTYTGKIVLQDDGVAQGGLIDTPEGNWYAFLFKDHGSVGRIPMLVPLKWKNGWPVMGINGKVPKNLSIDTKAKRMPGIVASDEFNGESGPSHYNKETSILSGLSLVWQWNHNPDPEHWSLSERPGYLRLTNGKLSASFVDTRNTLTQRTFGPRSTGTILMNTQNMKDGDFAGLGSLQGRYGFVGVKKKEHKKYLVMMKGEPDSEEEIETHPISQDSVYLRIAFDFKDLTDKAHFYYSLDGTTWNKIGDPLQMQYTLDHFVGYRFALFNYATKETGGSVDFDYFRVEPGLFSTSTSN